MGRNDFRQEMQKLLSYTVNQVKDAAPPPNPFAQVACSAIASQFKTAVLGITALAVLFALFIVLVFFDGIPAGASAAPSSPDPAAQEHAGAAALRNWREGLNPIWEGRIEVALGYGQGRDWKWHELSLRQVLTDDEGKVYLHGMSARNGEPRHFRLDKITRFRTVDGDCEAHGLDGTREALFTAISNASSKNGHPPRPIGTRNATCTAPADGPI